MLLGKDRLSLSGEILPKMLEFLNTFIEVDQLSKACRAANTRRGKVDVFRGIDLEGCAAFDSVPSLVQLVVSENVGVGLVILITELKIREGFWGEKEVRPRVEAFCVFVGGN